MDNNKYYEGLNKRRVKIVSNINSGTMDADSINAAYCELNLIQKLIDNSETTENSISLRNIKEEDAKVERELRQSETSFSQTLRSSEIALKTQEISNKLTIETQKVQNEAKKCEIEAERNKLIAESNKVSATSARVGNIISGIASFVGAMTGTGKALVVCKTIGAAIKHENEENGIMTPSSKTALQWLLK